MVMGFYYIPGVNDETEEIKLPIDKSTCYHRWVTYTGLNEVFQHCDLCGLKLD